MSKQILFGLECSHAAPGPETAITGTLVCAWCQAPKLVTGVIVWEWAAKCGTCNFTRWAGLSKQNAKIFADGHYRRNTSHTVRVEYLHNPTASVVAEKFLRSHLLPGQFKGGKTA